ncbi:MAG: cytochrome c3 family protein [Gemmatimonadales bacterium]|jgi:hypothetical protein
MRALVTVCSTTAAAALLLAAAGCREEPSPISAQASLEGWEAPVDLDTAALPGPVQPIFYRHDVHAGQYKMDCRYCHYAAEVSSSPAIPTVSQCMGCHIIAGAANPEVQKLREYWNERRPIEWIEIHKVSPFVKFPHNRHVVSDSASFGELEVVEKCETCHGPIREMPQVYQYASLKMGWCITCHEQEGVSTDCTVCHY